MRYRPPLALAIPVALVFLLLGLALGRPSPGQVAERPPVVAVPDAPGRYQAAIAGASTQHVVVIDTVTGHCWTKGAGSRGHWRNLGTPAADER